MKKSFSKSLKDLLQEAGWSEQVLSDKIADSLKVKNEANLMELQQGLEEGNTLFGPEAVARVHQHLDIKAIIQRNQAECNNTCEKLTPWIKQIISGSVLPTKQFVKDIFEPIFIEAKLIKKNELVAIVERMRSVNDAEFAQAIAMCKQHFATCLLRARDAEHSALSYFTVSVYVHGIDATEYFPAVCELCVEIEQKIKRNQPSDYYQYALQLLSESNANDPMNMALAHLIATMRQANGDLSGLIQATPLAQLVNQTKAMITQMLSQN